jgi:hypothetical protein
MQAKDLTRKSPSRVFSSFRTTRILEKQNRLQMSQVSFCSLRASHQVVLLFKDSKGGTTELGGTRFSDHFLEARMRKKNKRCMLVALGDLPRNKNLVPRLARPPSPAGAAPSAIELPHTSRWSEARPR